MKSIHYVKNHPNLEPISTVQYPPPARPYLPNYEAKTKTKTINTLSFPSTHSIANPQ